MNEENYTPAKGDYFTAQFTHGRSSDDSACMRADLVAGEFIFYSILTRPKQAEDLPTWTPRDAALFAEQWEFQKLPNPPIP